MAGVCAKPGCPEFATKQGKCDIHRRETNRHQHRTVPTKVARTHQVRQYRARAVKAHLVKHEGRGYCPGFGRPPHEVYPKDLTADDPVPIAHGGDPMQELIVMCRSCNSRKAAR